ncbi:MAG: ComEA family DNA-binding protein [candidate division WOR-3 bacterium]
MNPGEKRALVFALGSFLLGTLILFLARLGLHSRPISPDNFPRTEETYIKKVNLNTATAAELENLPGIGPKTAENIIQLRQERSGFNTMDELLEVKGMNEKKLEAIKPFIEVK